MLWLCACAGRNRRCAPSWKQEVLLSCSLLLQHPPLPLLLPFTVMHADLCIAMLKICKNLPPEFLSRFLEAMGRLKSWSWLALKRHSFQNINEKHIRSWEIIAGGNIHEININQLWSTLHNKRWDQGTSLSNHLGFCHWFTTCQWYKLDFTTAHKKSMDHWHHW